jgi:hypothetical protein
VIVWAAGKLPLADCTFVSLDMLDRVPCRKLLFTCSKFLFAVVVLCITNVSLFFPTGFILLIGIFGFEVRMFVVWPDCSSF